MNRSSHEAWLSVAPVESDLLETIVRRGAKLLLQAALEAEVTECLGADLDRMLTFYDFPAEHWRHVRPTNPIEAPFAAIRLRTNAMKRLPAARTCTATSKT